MESQDVSSNSQISNITHEDIRWTDNTTEGIKKSVEGLPVDEFLHFLQKRQ